MKRYYLSKIKQVSDPDFGLVYKHRLQEYSGIDYQGGEIKVDPTTGAPTEKALLVLVGGIDHKQFRDDPELIPLPDVKIDSKVSSIHTPTKLKVKQAIKALGLTDAEVEEVWGNADGLRDVLNHYGKRNNPDFDCDKFDLDES